MLRAFARQHQREEIESRLGRPIGEKAGERIAAGHRGDVDDAPLVLRLECAPDGAGEIEGAGEIGVDHAAPLIDGHFINFGHGSEADTVDQRVDPAEGGEGFVEQHPHIVDAGDIGHDGNRRLHLGSHR